MKSVRSAKRISRSLFARYCASRCSSAAFTPAALETRIGTTTAVRHRSGTASLNSILGSRAGGTSSITSWFTADTATSMAGASASTIATIDIHRSVPSSGSSRTASVTATSTASAATYTVLGIRRMVRSMRSRHSGW